MNAYFIVNFDPSKSFDTAGILCSISVKGNELVINDIIDNSKEINKFNTREITFSKKEKGSIFYKGLAGFQPYITMERLKEAVVKAKKDRKPYVDINGTYYNIRVIYAEDDDSAKLIYQLNLF